MTRRQLHQQKGARGAVAGRDAGPKAAEAKEAKEAKEPVRLSEARHGHIPELPRPMGELFYECTLFLYSAMALFCAYLNIYRALWWIPKAHIHYYAKLHLMDPYVLSCLGLVLGRRVTCCFFRSIPEAVLGEEAGEADAAERRGLRVAEFSLRLVMLTLLMSSFAVNAIKVVQSQGLGTLGLLLGPLLVLYVALFWVDMARGGVTGKGEGGLWERFNAWLNSETYPIDVCSVRHACSSSPAQVREEVEVVSRDLAQRLKQAFFSAAAVAWLSIWVPWRLAPDNLYVDPWWMSQLFVFVFLSALCLYLAYLFPLQYCHIVHQATSHLGRWELVREAAGQGAGPASSAAQGPPAAVREWEGLEVWAEGSLCRRGGREWRALGESEGGVAAVPGEGEWVELLGREPLRLLQGLCLLCVGVVGLALLLLLHSLEWQHLATFLLLLPANYLSLFFLFKDRLILARLHSPSEEDLRLLSSTH